MATINYNMENFTEMLKNVIIESHISSAIIEGKVRIEAGYKKVGTDDSDCDIVRPYILIEPIK
jgi:predicted HAD superfamily hydrolase